MMMLGRIIKGKEDMKVYTHTHTHTHTHSHFQGSIK